MLKPSNFKGYEVPAFFFFVFDVTIDVIHVFNKSYRLIHWANFIAISPFFLSNMSVDVHSRFNV